MKTLSKLSPLMFFLNILFGCLIVDVSIVLSIFPVVNLPSIGIRLFLFCFGLFLILSSVIIANASPEITKIIQKNKHWKNLAPNLCRQRIIIEATVENFIDDPEVIADYLQKLTEVVGMVPCREPIVYTAHEDGWGAWQHWKTSGATFYSYPSRNGDPALITLDCYTCKPFVVEKAVKFTESYFKTKEIVWKEVTK